MTNLPPVPGLDLEDDALASPIFSGSAPADDAHRVAGNVRHSLIGTTAARVFGALGGLLAARLLGPTLRGEYAIAFTLATVGSMLSAAGLQFWVVVEVASGAGREMVGRTVAWHSTVVLTLNLAFVGLATLWPVLAFNLSVFEVLGIASFSTTAAIGMLTMAVPIGRRDMRAVAVATSTGSFMFAAAVALLLVTHHQSVALVMAAATLGSLVSTGLALRASTQLERDAREPSPSLSTWFSALRSFIGAGLGEVVLLGMLRIDFLLMAILLPLRDVGLYAVAVPATEVLWVVPDAASQVALPVAAETSDDAAVPQLFRASLAATAIAGVALTMVCPFVLPLLFGDGFRSAARAVPLLAVAALAAGAWRIAAADVAARGRTSARLYTAGIGLVAMVAIDLIVIPRWGIVGGSLGAALGYSVAATAMIIIWSRLPNAQARELIRFQKGDLTLWGRILRRPRAAT